MKRVGVLIDFTYVSEIALRHAMLLPVDFIGELHLIHTTESEDINSVKQKLKDLSGPIITDQVNIVYSVTIGEFFSTIPDFLNSLELDLIVVGTHGIKGVSNPKYGLNILRLIKSVDIPFLIVQDHSEISTSGYSRILLPLFHNSDLTYGIDFLSELTAATDAELLVLDNIEESSTAQREKVLKDKLNKANKSFLYDQEEHELSGDGLVRSIVQYASIEDVKLIVLQREEHERFYTEAVIQALILNRQGFAVLYLC